MTKKKRKTTKSDKSVPALEPGFYLALADLHVGHACGVAPRGIRSHAGNLWFLNFAQEYLATCFDHMLTKIPEQLDGLFLVGDLGEGQNLASDSIFLSEPHPLFQARAAYALLKPVADRVKDGRIWIVSGSRYHAGRQKVMEEIIGMLLKAKARDGHYAPAWRKVLHRVTGSSVLFDVAHHQSYTYRYRSMPMEREIDFILARFARQRRVPPACIIILRAHVHIGYRVWTEGGASGTVEVKSITLPSFKIQDDFAQGSRIPNRMIPDNLGAVGIWVHPEPVNGSWVTVVPFLYDHPDIPEEAIEEYER